MKNIFAISFLLGISFCIKAQDFQPYHQIFLQDTILDIKKIEYEGDTTGKRLGFKLSDDRTVIQLFNYDGQSKVKIVYVSRQNGIVDITRYKCNIHSLPHL